MPGPIDKALAEAFDKIATDTEATFREALRIVFDALEDNSATDVAIIDERTVCASLNGIDIAIKVEVA